MDTTSPSTAPYGLQPQDYFIQPSSYMPYESNYDVSLDSLPPSDSPRLGYGQPLNNSLQLSNHMPYYPASYATHRGNSPIQSISPPLTNASASDLSGNDTSGLHFSSSRSSGTESPASVHQEFAPGGAYNGGVQRRQLRHNSSATATATRTSKRATPARRRSTRDDDFSDEEDNLPVTTEVVITKRREEVRRQRIESEQRRRDELRDGYRKLKDVLPLSNQKASKVSLLDRATRHITELELAAHHMHTKIAQLEAETTRLRNMNETLMLSTAEQRRNSQANF